MQHSHSGKQSAPAVFLDRDGTIIEDVGHLADPAGIELFPFAISALQQLQKKYLLFVVTNQSGVARGLLKMEDVNRVHQELDRVLRAEGIEIQEWYVCPHDERDRCDCKKPQTAFLSQAERDYAVDLRSSFAIGDHPHDAELGRDLGVTGLYVLTGHGRKHLDELQSAAPVFKTLNEATAWVESKSAGNAWRRSDA